MEMIFLHALVPKLLLLDNSILKLQCLSADLYQGWLFLSCPFLSLEAPVTGVRLVHLLRALLRTSFIFDSHALGRFHFLPGTHYLDQNNLKFIEIHWLLSLRFWD